MGDIRERNAFGAWVATQPRGTLTRAQRATGYAYSTIHHAQFRRVREDVAINLERFTGGRVRAASIAISRFCEAS
jgi:hypothetical protein